MPKVRAKMHMKVVVARNVGVVGDRHLFADAAAGHERDTGCSESVSTSGSATKASITSTPGAVSQ